MAHRRAALFIHHAAIQYTSVWRPSLWPRCCDRFSILYHSPDEFAPMRTEALVELRAEIRNEDVLRSLPSLVGYTPDLFLRDRM